VLGLIENMSGYVCPCCGEISNVFSTGGGGEMARREELNFLGRLPVDTELVSVLDGGHGGDVDGSFALLDRYIKTPSAKLFKDVVQVVIDRVQ
jgi:hypothetical protein